MSHTWLSHVTHMIESRHTYDWVMSHLDILSRIRTNLGTFWYYVTYANESFRTCMSFKSWSVICARLSTSVSSCSCTCVTWRIHMCDMTHSYVWHDAFMCVKWLIHMCDISPAHAWHDSFICAECDMRETLDFCQLLLLHMCEIDSFICVTGLMCMHDTTDPCAWHVISATLSISVSSCFCTCVTWLIHTCDMSDAQDFSQLLLLHMFRV